MKSSVVILAVMTLAVACSRGDDRGLTEPSTRQITVAGTETGGEAPLPPR